MNITMILDVDLHHVTVQNYKCIWSSGSNLRIFANNYMIWSHYESFFVTYEMMAKSRKYFLRDVSRNTQLD